MKRSAPAIAFGCPDESGRTLDAEEGVGLDQWRDELPTSDVKGRNPFKDLRVRRALALAIDEKTIAKRIMLGLAHPTWMLWGAGVNGYDSELDVRPQTDLAEARRLLAEAGHPNGFRVGFDCPNDRCVMDEQTCTAITAMLAQIRVRVDPIVQTKEKFFAKIQGPKFDTDMYLVGWAPASNDAHNVLYALFGTRNDTRGEFNYGGYSNPKLDDLIEHIGVEIDEPRRYAFIDEAAKILQDDVAAIPLHQQVIVWAAKKEVEPAQPANNAFPYRYVRMQ
jgi:peptide/nickel transport system substrate-binding protein